MSKIEWDTSQVNRLARDFSKAPGRVQRKVPKVLRRGALEIKRRIERAAGGHDYLPTLDQHVSYTEFNPFDYEIGFDKVGSGNLANIAAFGSINNAPIMESPAMIARRELPEIERHLGDAGEEAVLGTDKG